MQIIHNILNSTLIEISDCVCRVDSVISNKELESCDGVEMKIQCKVRCFVQYASTHSKVLNSEIWSKTIMQLLGSLFWDF